MIAEGSEGPLETNVVLLSILILNKLRILLIDRVVGQVHILVVFVELGGVLFGGESGQAFLVDVDPQRLIARHDYVDSQIELVSIDEKRVSDVARDD